VDVLFNFRWNTCKLEINVNVFVGQSPVEETISFQKCRSNVEGGLDCKADKFIELKGLV
jgi:hypothetical protein